jgi:8-oxo-dGTP pyrophosphatase MutT (NUDIX family)
MFRLTARRVGALGLAATASRYYVSHCQAVEHESLPPATALNALKFKGQFGGQFTPPPPKGEATTATGGVARAGGIEWQRGPFKSWWLRLGDAAPAAIEAALEEVLARGKASTGNAHPGTAVYVCIPELAANPDASRALYKRGFSYHHFAPAKGSEEGGEFVYYAWASDNPSKDDLVPAYATSTEGVGAILLSPDETKVLLVWEFGKWKPVSGHVDKSELSIRAATRELWEEVGASVDETFTPIMTNGFIHSQSKDRMINTNFHCYVLRAATLHVQPDAAEVSEARWFPRSALAQAWEAAGTPISVSTRSIMLAEGCEGLPPERLKLSTDVPEALSVWASGGGLACKVTGGRAGEKGQLKFGPRSWAAA